MSLHFKPTIAVGELDGTDTSGTIELMFRSPPAHWIGQMGTAHASHTSRAWGARAISDSSLACAWLAAARTPRAVLVWHDFGDQRCAWLAVLRRIFRARERSFLVENAPWGSCYC